MQFEPGQQIRHAGELGVFTVKYYHKNGDLTAFGGANGHAAWRSFKPENCRPVKKKGKRARKA